MSEHADKMIAQAQEQLLAAEQKVVDLKRFINQVRSFDGQPALYSDEAMTPSAATGQIRSDQFYGRPLATVVREILEMRKASNQGAASVAEIFATMLQGGFDFQAANDDNAKRMLRISLAKNAVFHKLPNGRYGLSEWYPAAAKPKKNANGKQAAEDVAEEFKADGQAVEDDDSALSDEEVAEAAPAKAK